MDIAKVAVRVTAEGVEETSAKLDSVGTDVGKLGQRVTDIGQRMALGVTTPLLGFGALAFKNASDIEESMSKVDVIFGENSGVIKDWADNALQNMNMTEASVLSGTGTFGNLFKTIGVDSAGAQMDIGALAGDITGLSADMLNAQTPTTALSMAMVGLARDAESFHNVPLSQALGAIESGLIGEYEPLRQFGVLLNEDKVAAKALEMGLVDANGEVTEQGKVMARAAIILEETSTAHGDAGRTAGSAANQYRLFKNSISEFSAEMGKVLLPGLTKMFGFLSNVLGVLSNLSPTAMKIIAVFGLIAAAIGPLLIVFGTLISSIATIGAAFGAGGVLAGVGAALGAVALPILAIVAALAALGIAYKTNFLGFRDAVNAVAGAVASGFRRMINAAKPFIEIFKMMSKATNPVQAAFFTLGVVFRRLASEVPILSGVFEALADAMMFIEDFIDGLIDTFNYFNQSVNPVSAALKALGAMLQGTAGHFGPFEAAVRNLGDVFAALGRAAGDVGDILQAVMEGDWREALDEASSLVRNLADAFLNMHQFMATMLIGALTGLRDILMSIDWGAVSDAILDMLQSASDAILNWLGTAVEAIRNYNWSGLWDNVKEIAGDLVQKFGDLKARIAEWLVNAVSGINWGAMWATVKDVTSDIVKGFGNLNAKIATWLVDAVSGINWGAMWATVKDVTNDIVQKFGDLKARIATWLVEAVTGINWSAMWAGVKETAGDLVQKFGDLSTKIFVWLAAEITEVDWTALAGSIRTALTTALELLTMTVGSLPSFAGSIATAIAEAVAGKIREWSGETIKGAISEKLNALVMLAGRFLSFAGSIATAIAESIATKVREWSGETIKGAISEKLNQLIAVAADFATFASSIGGALKDAILQWVRDNITWEDLKGALPFGDKFRVGQLLPAGGLGVGPVDPRATERNEMTQQPLKVPAPDLTAYLAGLMVMKTATIQAFTQIAITALTGTTGMSTAVNTTANAMATQFTSRLQQMSSQASNLFNQMRSQITATAQGMSSQVNSVVNSMASQVQSRFQQMVSQATSQVNQMRSQVSSGFQQTASQAASAMNQLASAVQQGFQRAAQAAQQGVNQIRAAVNSIGSLYSQGYSIGGSLGDGIAAGISSRVSAIAAAAANAVTSAINAAAAAGAITSPSKYMRQIGQWLMQGGTLGVQDETMNFVDSVKQAFTSALPVVGSMYPINPANLPVSGGAYGNITINALKSDELVNLIAQAERGGNYASDARREAVVRYRNR